MKPDRCAGIGFSRTLIAAALSLILIAPGAAANGRKGAQVVVTNKDGTVVQGELLAVRGERLVVREAATDDGLELSLKDAATIGISRKGSFGKGAGMGFLVGGLGGAVMGFAVDNEDASLHGAELAMVTGISLGAIGALIGGVVGLTSRSDQIIVVERTDEAYLAEIGAKLRRQARDRS